MSEFHNLISALESKTGRLLRYIDALKAQLMYQQQRQSELLQTVAEKDKKIAHLEEQINRLQSPQGVANYSTGNGTHEASLKINELVREINQCIALLNR